jgi:hypothetical protein
MKTEIKSSQNRSLNSLGLFITLIIASCAFTTTNAQTKKVESTEITQSERFIKGVISDSNGPLESASVVLKGTNTGTTTNSKGEFTFPTPLNTGDVLLISYLGFETQEAKIKESTTFLRLMLTTDLIEFVGALNTDKPYKSKRSN